jgi:hypothetical protein
LDWLQPLGRLTHLHKQVEEDETTSSSILECHHHPAEFPVHRIFEEMMMVDDPTQNSSSHKLSNGFLIFSVGT